MKGDVPVLVWMSRSMSRCWSRSVSTVKPVPVLGVVVVRVVVVVVVMVCSCVVCPFVCVVCVYCTFVWGWGCAQRRVAGNPPSQRDL